MELNKQIQLNHSIIKEGVTIAVLSGSLSIDSNNVGNINTGILNQEFYLKYKSEVQASIREFYNQFFVECDALNNPENTDVVESNDEVIEDAVDNGDDIENEIETEDVASDTSEDTE